MALRQKLNTEKLRWKTVGVRQMLAVSRSAGCSPSSMKKMSTDNFTEENLNFRRRQMMMTKTHKKMNLETVGAVRERERERERIVF